MSTPLRVLHLASGNLYGGVEVFLRTLARRGTPAGLTSGFTVCWEGRFAQELRAAGAAVHSLGEVRLSRPWQVWRARRRLADRLRVEIFDLAVVHSAWTHALFGPVVRRAGLPLIMGVHTVLPSASLLERWARRIPVQGVFTNSHFTAASARNWYPGFPNAEVIRLPVEKPRILEPAERVRVRKELGAAPADCVLIQACRMQAWKGVHTLVSALDKLGLESGWSAWIVGGAQRGEEVSYEAQVRSQIRRAGLTHRIRLLGQREDVASLLGAADVYVQVNQTPEPFGIVFVEAAYAGIPSVSAASGGSAEFVDDSCGVRVASGDSDGLAHELLSLVRDPDRRRRLGVGGLLRAQELCDPERQVACLAQFFRARGPANG